MRSILGAFAALQLIYSTLAQDTSTLSSSQVTTSLTSAPAVSSSTSSTKNTAAVASGTVVVDAAGGAQFTAISPAISYAQTFAQPTIIVRAGTYNEAVSVIGNAAVTIIGDSSSPNDYSQNQVTISNSGAVAPVTINSNSVQGITWRNINFINPGTGNTPTVSLRGMKNAFYNCQFISSGLATITSTLGSTIIANSYIEGTDKLFYNYLSMYIFNSTITATLAQSATIVYSKGYVPSTGSTQISQTVFDSCNIIQKSGTTSTLVYLAGPNGDGAQAVFKYTSMASFIAAAGTRALGTNGFFGEYQNTGPGSYAYSSSRVDTLMTSSMLANWTVDYVFAHAFSGYTTTMASWVDATVLQAIVNANMVATNSVSSSAVSSSTSSILTSTSASTSWSTNSVSDEATSSSSLPSLSASSFSVSSASTRSIPTTSPTSSTTSVLPSLTCTLPASIPSSAFVVGPSGSCATNSSIGAAIAALPADSTTQYIYLLAGTYTEQVSSFARVGPTIFRGESSSPLDQSANLVTIQYSGSVISSAGGSEAFSVFRSTQYNSNNYAFYNINFVNIAPITPNYVAIAMDIKSQKVGFYSCGFTSGQGTLLVNDGSFYLSGCKIEGSADFIWGYGVAFISNSLIVSNVAGNSIAAQSYVAKEPSQMVFDQCSFIPKTSAGMSQSTYLGRDYSTSSRVAITNSFMDAHIQPAGWLIKNPATANVTFFESNNTGPGYVPASRISQDTILKRDNPYSITKVLGDVSWIDQSAAVPFSGFADSQFVSSSSSTSSSSVTSTGSVTSSTSAAASTASVLPASATYVVSTTPNATEYGTVEAAISALPNDGADKYILINPGTYTEQININRTGKVTLRGVTSFTNDFSQNQVTIQFNYGVSTSAGQDELTPVINSKKTDGSGLALYNINFVNTFAQQRNYAALAADFYGDKMAAYGCSFIGFQDTLLANKGSQLFSNCYIEGSVDFIWGYSKAYFHQCEIATNTPGASISAQSSSLSSMGGYVFDACLITYTSTYGASMGLSYLGRPYSNYSVAIYKNSYIDQNINAAGWSVWQSSNPQTSNVMFGEYNNVGPSAWTASIARASFATNLTDSQVAAYDLGTFLGTTSWIDMAAYGLTPSFNFSSTGTTGAATLTSSSVPTSTATANSTSGHPISGTTPPTGAVLVSVGGSIANSFSNLTSALASLPADTTSQTIFMYPGSYTEQVSVNRAGPVTIVGYQSGSVGQTYTGNQVTVIFARGLSVIAPVAAGHTDAETAVIATASKKISFYNVNFVNTANSDGATASYVTLAASIYGDQIGFYGCSFVGWQDTLLTGNPSGYAYYESSYIEGAIDFIWGYSLSYFKGCTIGAKKAKSCFTAHSRASMSAIGGYVFDQCLFTAAASAPTDLTSLVYLGRPYSQYARVAIKYSYLDNIIQPQGWKAWSTSDPRLDGATFVEYQNTGPGNWENNTAARLAFGNATLLTSDTYTLSSVMPSTSWIDMTYWDSIVTPQSTLTTTPATGTVNTTTVGNSTSPPDGACIVSKTAITGLTVHSTVAECIGLLPSTSVVSTIFIYPGTYNEQLTFNRSGETIIRGYADNSDSFSSNQVIITNSNGVDTQSDQSNSDSATLYSRGKNLKLYNVNLVNAFGTTNDYASLGFAIGNNGNASFYGCQVVGNQDTFDVNAGASVFVYNSYIEGSVDFIWGSGSMYFLSSTISPNIDDISITADKRTASTSIGGIVFDQCKVTPSVAGAKVAGVTGSISLGRPWNANARVAYIQTYLDSCVSAAGWEQWSSSTPNTDGVFFGEYQNTGPGALSTSRAAFSHQMTDAEASGLQLDDFFSSTSWIDLTALKVPPFVVSSIPQTVTITSTVSPTGSPLVVTSTSTAILIYTTGLAISVITKNMTEKVSTTILTTQPDVYKFTTATASTTSFLFVTPIPKITTQTLNEIVSTTLTITGQSTTTTELVTSKLTGLTTLTPAPVTSVQTFTTSEVQLAIVTPKAVTKVITSLQTDTTTIFLTPKAKFTTLVSTSTIIVPFTAGTPQITATQTSSSVISITKTSTPKSVTQTTTFSTTILAGPTVTVQAKAATSYVSVTSIVLKSTKTTSALTCVTPQVKRSFTRRSINEGPVLRRAVSSSSYSTPTVIVTYTLPQSTSTFLVLASTISTKIVAALKTTEIDTYTSYLVKTSVFPGQTFISTLSTTNTVLKTSTLPTSTSTILVDLVGTSIQTTTAKGFTVTQTSIVLSTVKTSTKTLPALTVLQSSTKTVQKTTTTTLPTQTISSTITSINLLTITSVLPTPTITSSLTTSLTIRTTSTPAAVAQTVVSVVLSTQLSTTTLPTPVRLVSQTVTSRVPTPTVTHTSTMVKTTTVKSTSLVVSTVYSTPKGLPTCS